MKHLISEMKPCVIDTIVIPNPSNTKNTFIMSPLVNEKVRLLYKQIISIGMISEGTNIPRLHVCCYLSAIKTELYFRQVLGRVLRSTTSVINCGYMFLPADPDLKKFAERIAIDLPEYNVFSSGKANSMHSEIYEETDLLERSNFLTESSFGLDFNDQTNHHKHATNISTLSSQYESQLGFWGIYKQSLLSL